MHIKSCGMKAIASVRKVTVTDAGAFVEAARRSREFHRPWTTAPCDLVSFQTYHDRFDGTSHFGFVVYLASTNELVGAINLTNVVYGSFRSGYLGYFAFAGYEGKGLMKQGLSLVCRYSFSKLHLHRVEANIQPKNLASTALVQRCGFMKEGYSTAYLKIGGKWRDHERWALVNRRTNAAQLVTPADGFAPR